MKTRPQTADHGPQLTRTQARPAQHMANALVCWSVVCGLSSVVCLAAQWPSLFRGVVVTDSPIGVRVVSVEPASQAYQADLRPDDIIIRIRDHDVGSIDEFAELSSALKGRFASIPVLVFRQGAPRELTLHVYSYAVLKAWGVEFVPEHDIRFAEPQIGLDYWTRMGRGFETAGKPKEALDAYLNGLHNMPLDATTALKATELWSAISQRQLNEHQLTDGISGLRHTLTMMEHLFDYPLTEAQLASIRQQLKETLQALKRATATPLANQTAV